MTDDIDYGALTTLVEEEEGGNGGFVQIGGPALYCGEDYYVTVRLSDFHDARVLEDENPATGEPERGVFIPIRSNGLLVTPSRKIMATFRMEQSLTPSPKATHRLMQVLDRDVANERKKLGFAIMPMGFARPTRYKRKGKKK